MRHSPLLLALVLGFGAQVAAQAPLEITGGSGDDQAFARAAAGLTLGEAIPPGGLPAALAAIQATDRFRRVEMVSGRVVLDPWPPLRGITWRGEVPADLRKQLFPGVHKGDRVGNLRLEALRAQAQERLVAAGFPEAKVGVGRPAGEDWIVVSVDPGPANLIKAVEVVGRTGPWSAAQLVREVKAVPGRTRWNREFELECLRRLRKKMVKAKRFESQVDLDWDAGGTLRVTVDVGPKVRLKAQGPGLGWTTSLKDLVPLARAERYSPELLDEGERRIVRFLRASGHLDPQVTYRREVVKTGSQGPEEVVVTYILDPGPVTELVAVAFEGNQAISTGELRAAAGVEASLLAVKARPEAMDAIEDRVQKAYEDRGYTEARIHRSVERKGGKATLVIRIREGRRRLVSWVRLDLPPDGFGDPWGLGECLPLLCSDKVHYQSGRDGERIYRSDRPGMEGVEGALRLDATPEGLRLTLSLSRPIPLLKADLFRVYTAVRQQHLVSLGVLRPVVRSQVVDEGTATGIRIEVPAQPQETMKRLVVQGSERTRAKAVLREIPLKPGDPLDLDKLNRAQGRLGSLGAFRRVDLESMEGLGPQGGEGPAPAPGGTPQAAPGARPEAQAGPPVPWQPGDLVLRTEEGTPWLFTHSFGYDPIQGYYIGSGAHRLNVGGMGRTLDFDVRAGDGTINNPTLRSIFRTGHYTNSLDSYSVAYGDPWFAPGKLGQALPDRTAFRIEGAYIQEQKFIYDVHRRRILASLRWQVGTNWTVESGYRIEDVEVLSNDPAHFSAANLAYFSRYPPHSLISAPYAQVVRDTRDSAFDPTRGTYTLARFEAAAQAFGTDRSSSFLKLDLRNQWTWPIGYKARAGVVAFGVRVGVARPTASTSQVIPLSERFFGGGPGSNRGIEPDFLGPLDVINIPQLDNKGNPVVDSNSNPVYLSQQIPLGGQVLVLANLEYRFPLIGQWLWGEVWVDSGQVYDRLQSVTYTPLTPNPENNSTAAQYLPATFPAMRTATGIGLIFKIGVPIKIEYGADINRILGRPRSQDDRDSQLKHLLISAGFQF